MAFRAKNRKPSRHLLNRMHNLPRQGCMRASGPYNVWNTCLACGGEGMVVRDGEREGDSDGRTQPTWGDVLWFSLWTAAVTALFCWLLIWRAKGH